MQAGQPRPCIQRKRRVRTGLSSANADFLYRKAMFFFCADKRAVCACLCQERCCRVFLQRQVVVGHIVPYLSAVSVVLPIIVVEVEGIGGLDDFVLFHEASQVGIHGIEGNELVPHVHPCMEGHSSALLSC